MIQRYHTEVFSTMSPESSTRKLTLMKALAKTIKTKNKENEDPLNNNMGLSCNFFIHSTPLKNQQITDLDVIEPEPEEKGETAETGLGTIQEIVEDQQTQFEKQENPSTVRCVIYDDDGKCDNSDIESTSESLAPDLVTTDTVTISNELYENDKHWRSLEALHENAEYEFCRSLDESKLYVSTSSLLEEIEADLPSPYSLARPLSHTFHTLNSYRTQTRLARMDVNLSCPEIQEERENSDLDVLTEKIHLLEKQASVQKALAKQSEKALILSKTNKLFGAQHIECEKALLLADLRCNAASEEAKRLKSLREVSEEDDFGEIIISDVYFEMNDSTDNNTGNYLCVFTERENVHSTSVKSEFNDKKLHFSEPLKFQNLRKDFVIHIQLFSLQNKEPKKRILSTALARKLRKTSFSKSVDISSCNFCGFAKIAQGELRIEHIISRENDKCTVQNCLTGNVMHPLVGTSISLVIKTDVNIKSNQSGFLNVFKKTWHRRWFSLSGYFLESWLYPEDQEFDKAPLDSIYLPNCSSVESVGMDVCIRPHSFIITLKENAGEILFSAGSHKDMLTWVDHLNLTLESIRLWKPNV